ncbi:hypothetical protein BHM03_00045184 [Ensete ventricosum]|nr:hypothetical protein BHM03_00045184 [Ensete ventricosum]
MIHGATRTGGHPGSATRAPMPITIIVQSSVEVLEVRAEAIPGAGPKVSGKRPVEGASQLWKRVKVSDRHMSCHGGEGSKSHSSKVKEQVGVTGKAQTPYPLRPTFVKELC